MPLYLGGATTTAMGYQSAADKLQQDGEYYDVVADGGADPTGVVDATAIFNTAVTSFGAAGGIVFVPIGTYKISGPINCTNNYVTIRGASRVASKLQVTIATGDVFVVTGIVNRFETLRIEGLNSGLRTSGYAINIGSAASNCSAQWVDIIYMWSGIKASGQLMRMEDMNIRESGANAPNGQLVLIDTFTDQYMRCIVADNPANQTGFAGVRITNLSSLIMSDCQIIHCGIGMDLAPTTTNTIPSVFCSNTFFDNGVIGLSITGAAGNVKRCHFNNCWFSSNTAQGVLINAVNTNEVAFSVCQFYQNTIGIDAQAATDWTVRGSAFAGNTVSAIKTTAAATHSFTISENMIGDTGGFGPNAQGINIQAGTYKRYAVVDNRGFETNTTKGWIDLGTVGASDQKNVFPNVGGLLSGAMATIGANVVSVNATEFAMLSLRVPANSVRIGDTFRIRLFGVSQGAGTLTWRVRVGTNGAAAPASDNQAWVSPVSAAQVANSRAHVEAYVTVKSLIAAAAEGWGYNTAVVFNTATGAAATAAFVATADWFITLSVVVSTSTFTGLVGAIEIC